MEKMKRAIQLDFHTLPGIEDFGKDWDAKGFAKLLKKSHVAYINAPAQCNLGFCYYPSKIGVPYPQMKFDLFGSLREACREEGIKVIAYVSTGLNHEQSRRNPQWCQIDKEGRMLRGDRATTNFFRTVCYNTSYREHIKAEIQEILTKYDVDGFFLDSVVVRDCWCPKCMEKMSALGLDINDYNTVLKFGWDTTMDFAKEIREMLPEGKTVKFNGLPGSGAVYTTHGEIECLPCGGWGYDSFWPSVAASRNFYKHVIYMTGRFQASWGDFGGFRTKASIENDFYDALCNNAQISLGDHLHPSGKPEAVVYKTVEEIYGHFEKYEKWTDDAEYAPEIGIVKNKTGHLDSYVLTPSYKGAVRMLGELKYNCDIIGEDNDFDRFDLLILPDELTITPKIQQKLEKFLESGKKVISSGTSGLGEAKEGFIMKQWDFMEFCGEDSSARGYYKNLLLENEEAQMRWAMYSDGVLVKAKKSATVIAKYVKPYFDCHWDGNHGYFYTPPAEETEYAAALMSDQVCHISFKIFAAYFERASKFHKDLVKAVLERFLPNPLIKADSMPSTSRVTLTQTDNYRLLHVKVTHPEPRGKVNIVEEHTVLPRGYEVSVRGEYKTVKLLPNETPVDFRCENGYTTVTLPEINGYAMFVCE